MITERIEYVGGEEQKPQFVLEVSKYDHTLGDVRIKTVTLTSTEFDAMKWHTDYWPTGWGIKPGSSNREAVKYAIWALSEKITKERKVYQHLGWTKLDTPDTESEAVTEYWAYLHGGGAIGANGAIRGVETDFGATDLGKYVLPGRPSGQVLMSAVRKVFQFTELTAEDRPNSAGLAAICLSLPWCGGV